MSLAKFNPAVLMGYHCPSKGQSLGYNNQEHLLLRQPCQYIVPVYWGATLVLAPGPEFDTPPQVDLRGFYKFTKAGGEGIGGRAR